MSDIGEAVTMLLGLSDEPMKVWELQRAIGCPRSTLDEAVDALVTSGHINEDAHGYLTLVGRDRKDEQ